MERDKMPRRATDHIEECLYEVGESDNEALVVALALLCN